MILMIIIRALTMLTFQAEESDTFRAGLFTTGGAGAKTMMMMMMMMLMKMMIMIMMVMMMIMMMMIETNFHHVNY